MQQVSSVARSAQEKVSWGVVTCDGPFLTEEANLMLLGGGIDSALELLKMQTPYIKKKSGP